MKIKKYFKKIENKYGKKAFTFSIQIYYFSIFSTYAFLDMWCIFTVSLYKLEDKQKPRTKLSMYPVNIHIGELKTAFT